MSKRYLIQVLVADLATGGYTWENVKFPATGRDWMCRKFETALADVATLRVNGESRELAIVESKPVYATQAVKCFPELTEAEIAEYAELKALRDVPVKHDYDAHGICVTCGEHEAYTNEDGE